jgi:hypothetical protein
VQAAGLWEKVGNWEGRKFFFFGLFACDCVISWWFKYFARIIFDENSFFSD